MRPFWSAICLSLTLAWPASADPESLAQGFTRVSDYAPVDPAALDQALDAALADRGLAQKDADVTAIEKALLLVELSEAPLPRSRYIARLGVTWSGEIPVSFIEVTRYNLGPATRAELIAAYGAENVAAPEEFGLGPHVSWRFATQPVAKAAALILSASRHELTEAEADAALCPAQACLAVGQLAGFADWAPAPADEQPLPPMAYGARPATAAPMSGEAELPQQSTALIAIRLAIAAGLADGGGDGILWTATPDSGAGTPFAEWIIDSNSGQESGLEGYLRIAPLDGEPGPRWLRLTTTGEVGANITLWTIPGDLPPPETLIPEVEN
ncbi:hypothetical protein [Gemmobacter sp. 24YEA27]|uniref:hypothetical protein n=1 Tax=Gemmobacter sp. 24YEA27 TaxID=3040672 RepID=UPI0024B35EBA|nr:hypothetical protein [Gemmobacter sp. 24YEA27]